MAPMIFLVNSNDIHFDAAIILSLLTLVLVAFIEQQQKFNTDVIKSSIFYL